MQGWELPPPTTPLARGGVSIVGGACNGTSHSLRLIGPGGGWLQSFPLRDIYPEMRLEFYTCLSATAGEMPDALLPQALFHLYFFPSGPSSPTYYVDITVTLLNNEDLAAVFEPNPNVDTGGIYLQYNREPVNTWVRISVDISSLIERNFPDFMEPQVSRIMLESAEEGKVYFDNVSIRSTNCVLQSVCLGWIYLQNGPLTKTIAQFLSFSVVGGVVVSAYHWLEKRRKGSGH